MKKKLYNCRIINPFGTPEFINNGYICIENETICCIGEGKCNCEADEAINLNGKTVLPGMINAHAHLYSALAMGMPFPKLNPKNFPEKLKYVWWILDRALDKESTQASFESGLLDHLRHGVTTVIDHHSSQSFVRGSLNLLAETAERFGMNVSGAFEMTDRNSEDVFKESLNENIQFHRDYYGNRNVRPLIGLHASFTLSDQSLQQIADRLHHESNWGIHIHTSEDIADQDDAVKRGFSSVIQRLESFNLLNENSLVIHGVHYHPGDTEILLRNKTSFVHNPTSNANNRVGMTPDQLIEEMKSGLGTDGMQGNMLGEAKEGTLIRSSHLNGGEETINYLELLFKNNSEIASKLFGRKIGKLDRGYAADLAIYDYLPRTPINEANITGHLLFGMKKPESVMTNGEFRIKNNKLVDVDEERIQINAKIQAETLWRKMENIEKEER